MDGGMFSKGGSDPFPTCAVEGKKAKGTVKKKCLAPIWLEVFDLPAEDPDSVFTFQIDDHDLVGASDFMGLCRVRLGSLSDEKAHRKWHPLGNVKGEVDEIPRGAVWKSNLQPDFNLSVCDGFDASSSSMLRELDESNRFVQKSAESTSI